MVGLLYGLTVLCVDYIDDFLKIDTDLLQFGELRRGDPARLALPLHGMFNPRQLLP
jgi:hypothetical protein